MQFSLIPRRWSRANLYLRDHGPAKPRGVSFRLAKAFSYPASQLALPSTWSVFDSFVRLPLFFSTLQRHSAPSNVSGNRHRRRRIAPSCRASAPACHSKDRQATRLPYSCKDFRDNPEAIRRKYFLIFLFSFLIDH